MSSPAMTLPQPARLDSPAAGFLVGWEPAVGRKLVDQLRQVLAQAIEQLIARKSGLLGERADGVGAERRGEIVGCDLFVLAAADPGLRSAALTGALQIL